jgi:hypothetical protein
MSIIGKTLISITIGACLAVSPYRNSTVAKFLLAITGG